MIIVKACVPTANVKKVKVEKIEKKISPSKSREMS